ncbi:MAG: hypothetical protein L6R00_00325 [Phycisphaerae bacterium]|nr:hypothetical protein [Phycisphaerae bacterium]
MARIYARRYSFALPDALTPLEDRQFVVDSNTNWSAVNFVDANPTVSLFKTADEEDPRFGRFIVAWNARRIGQPLREIHARYFEADGRPRGTEFRVHQQEFETDENGNNLPYLAESGQHTVVYGPDDQVVATWTVTGETSSDPPRVFFTILPTNYADTLTGDCLPCIKGDFNCDTLIDGDDIQPFITALYAADSDCLSIGDLCRFDINYDAVLDTDDVPGFVLLLLGAPAPLIMLDCNTNGTPDANDIFEHTSLDCNSNFIPDECDAAGATSADVNTNNVPDECEPDCNGNATPDELDITAATSRDVNTNGKPDECEPDCNTNNAPDSYDVTTAASEDCNSNGVPDECDRDCNSNGTPDYCDVRDLYSSDCNTNLRPDECEDDCNTNGTPDACDLAAQSSPDCNTNRLPDECDLILPFMPSEDADSNGTPDECEEGESAQGGGESGGSGESQGGESEESDAGGSAPLTDEQRREALSELLTWIRDNDLRSLPHWQQYPLFDKKARELGLW